MVARRITSLAAILVSLAGHGAWAEHNAALSTPDLPLVELPPAIEGLIGMPQTYTKGRQAYLALITRTAAEQGLPPAVADAVAQVESSYNPNSVGGVGEVGLMQIRPQTAAMLGYRGEAAGLFEPETNVRYAVAYLARAWQLAAGDLCRTLMKYRAGHGEERMTPLSIEYCRRARGHLAAIGSPLASGEPPTGATLPFANGPASPTRKVASTAVRTRRVQQAAPLAATARTGRVRVASASETLARAQLAAVIKARQDQVRRMWNEHESRLAAINAKLKPARLSIARGI